MIPSIRSNVAHLLLVEVVGEAGPEGFLRQELVHHPDDGGSFGVGDGVEDLLDLVRMLDRDGDGVGGGQGVQPEHPLEVRHHELTENRYGHYHASK